MQPIDNPTTQTGKTGLDGKENATLIPAEEDEPNYLELAGDARSLETQKKYLSLHIAEIESITDPTDKFEAIELFYQSKPFFSTELQDYFPEEVTGADKVVIRHEHNLRNELSYSIRATVYPDNHPPGFAVHFSGDPNATDFINEKLIESPGYIFNGHAFINLEEPVDPIPSSASKNEMKATSYEKNVIILAPLRASFAPMETSPYNQKARKVIVMVPYTNEYPLPSNYASVVNELMTNSHSYFLSNSENKLDIDFDLVSVKVNPGMADPTLSYVDTIGIIQMADPQVNYTPYDFIAMAIPSINNWGGFATSYPHSFDFGTNEPVNGAIATTHLDFSDPQIEYSKKIFNHELGHVLSYWNPASFNAPYLTKNVPHASSSSDISQGYCQIEEDKIICFVSEYGNLYDTMGYGYGLFNHHSAVYRAGLRESSRVQKITQSGEYELCPIQENPEAGDPCAQELFIENKNGMNVGVEFRIPTGPDAYPTNGMGCPSSVFDGILIYATDWEEGDSFGAATYPHSGAGGDVLIQAQDTIETCSSGQGFPLFPLPVGKTFSSPGGDITLKSITFTGPLAKPRAHVTIDYQTDNCESPLYHPLVTESIVFCGEKFDLPQGIVVKPQDGKPLNIVCNGTTFEGTDAIENTGITVDASNGTGDVTITGCQFQIYSTGISVQGKTSITIKNNQFQNILEDGISVDFPQKDSTKKVVIKNNTLSVNSIGVQLKNTNKAAIYNNTIETKKTGIVVLQSNKVKVYDNTVTALIDKTQEGVTLEKSKDGKLYSNKIEGFETLVHALAGSTGWKIYYNNFIHAGEEGSVLDENQKQNRWYNKNVKKGNYWSPFSCTDNKPPAGICENKKSINGAAKDKYPVAKPFP